MNRARILLGGLLLGGAVALSCSDPPSTATFGTNSNWFKSCGGDSDCSSSTSCACTRCTRSCEVDADCQGLSDAHCVAASDPSSRSQCVAGDAPGGICLPSCTAGSCADDQACVAGSCVSDVLPDNAFCAPVAASNASERTQEDELFALVQTMRSAGGVSCGSNAPSGPASVVVRASAPLRCAARVLAADIDATGNQSLVDSSGRNTTERLAAAGYTQSLWSESFAIDTSSPNEALSIMLADPTSCVGLTRDGYTDLGVAAVGRAYVVTLGAE